MRVVNCSEPERFQPAGYWASQGLETEEQVRWEMLWQAATSETDVARQTLKHADGCDYCGDIVDRFRHVAYAMKPGRPVELAICPSAAELFDFSRNQLPAGTSSKIDAHAKKCESCSGELRWLARAERQFTRPVIMTKRATMVTMLALAATLLIGAVIFRAVKGHTTFEPIQDKEYSTKYRDLARLPLLDRPDLMKAAPSSHWSALDKAMSALELGDSRRAVGLAARVVNNQDEPAAEYVLGRALYREHMISSANEALLKSERMNPMSSYRCWSALQMGLILGDKDTILRECKHLQNDPQYAAAVQKILTEVQRRG
jgi:hypothetical protein